MPTVHTVSPTHYIPVVAMKHKHFPKYDKKLLRKYSRSRRCRRTPRRITRVLKKFFLRLNYKGKNLNLYMSNERNGNEYLAKMKSGVYDWRSWFVYDTRTRSIRLAERPEFALAV